ncbi:SDR family oxidoreductase [Streptomyces chromofuscus]|uniref:SDR family oxidoreductase n=1 Tax=Streptomyces chromofuscus TaxID=42881 RepID=A0A7M2TC28_STRCW|nr:SDR family oxidoreductase [Streptomyces chromofuscus]QOV44901.1 SDR family oxidoreductase [Streptomyces chromofuscus]GGT36923.1 short-chain dehydrogenase [Streptomyces chromofuscus]
MHSSPLGNRTVVVTGAARGLGAALARAVAGRGARVALLGHEGPELEAVATALPTATVALEVDITDPAALAGAARTVRARLGPPSVVIANAGIAEGGPFLTSDPATWQRVIDVNLAGSAHTARAFLPDLITTAGHYLQVASLASLGAAPLMSAYCASKAGVEAFAHSLRAEVAHHGVSVGIAYLNWIDTDMVRDADRYAVLRQLRLHMPPPARRVYGAEEVAERIVRGLERRRTAVYAPSWLRLVQPVRAALPPLVLRVSRRRLPRLEAEEPFHATGLLGAGGEADRAAADHAP